MTYWPRLLLAALFAASALGVLPGCTSGKNEVDDSAAKTATGDDANSGGGKTATGEKGPSGNTADKPEVLLEPFTPSQPARARCDSTVGRRAGA